MLRAHIQLLGLIGNFSSLRGKNIPIVAKHTEREKETITLTLVLTIIGLPLYRICSSSVYLIESSEDTHAHIGYQPWED